MPVWLTTQANYLQSCYSRHQENSVRSLPVQQPCICVRFLKKCLKTKPLQKPFSFYLKQAQVLLFLDQDCFDLQLCIPTHWIDLNVMLQPIQCMCRDVCWGSLWYLTYPMVWAVCHSLKVAVKSWHDCIVVEWIRSDCVKHSVICHHRIPIMSSDTSQSGICTCGSIKTWIITFWLICSCY